MDTPPGAWSTRSDQTIPSSQGAAMRGYAIGILNDVHMGPPLVEYLEHIDSTLAPYGGRFIVHGDPADMREGADPGDVIIIEFPDRAHAAQWYVDMTLAARATRSGCRRRGLPAGARGR
jgi:uncharacterized protein (DUF1330 family)